MTLQSAGERAQAVLGALEGGTYNGRTVLVVAHPCDETASTGGLMSRFPDLTLVHVTDGAPEDMTHARRIGYGLRETYREARAAELGAALTALGLAPARRSYALAERATADALALLTGKLQPELGDAELVITHAYEGGHPDHDSCAFAVQAACALMARARRDPPVRLEFPSYHRNGSRRVAGRFHPDPVRPERTYPLTQDRLAAKQGALAAFRSQSELLGWFTEPGVERLRAASDQDFTAKPPPGDALYDSWGWSFTSRMWRERAQAALRALGLADAPR